MSSFWFGWLRVWSIAMALFGLILALAAFPATDGPTAIIMGPVGHEGRLAFTPELRFAFALMGALTIGWVLTMWPLMNVARDFPDAAPALWRGLTVALLLWYLLDSGLSIALGYAGNAVSNSLLMIGYLMPMMATAAWQRR